MKLRFKASSPELSQAARRALYHWDQLGMSGRDISPDVWQELLARCPFKGGQIFRGINLPKGSQVDLNPPINFSAWTTDLQIAKQFAATYSIEAAESGNILPCWVVLSGQILPFVGFDLGRDKGTGPQTDSESEIICPPGAIQDIKVHLRVDNDWDSLKWNDPRVLRAEEEFYK